MFAKSCFQRANRKTRFECLEGRRLMAGDVRAYVQDGTLHLNGDAAANWVEVQEISPAHFRVSDRGLGTRINVQAFVDFVGVTSIDAHLGGGYDALYIQNIVDHLASIKIDMGAGGDSRDWRFDEVHLGTLTINGNLTVGARQARFRHAGIPLACRRRHTDHGWRWR